MQVSTSSSSVPSAPASTSGEGRVKAKELFSLSASWEEQGAGKIRLHPCFKPEESKKYKCTDRASELYLL